MDTGTNYADLFYLRSAIDTSELEKNVKDNPASSIARFLLLYHYKKNNDPCYETFANQSSLYFNNPFWLQLQLSQAGLKQEKSPSSKNESEKESGHFAIILPEEKDEPDHENKDNISFKSDDENNDANNSIELNNGFQQKDNKDEITSERLTDEKIEDLQTNDNNEFSKRDEEEEVASEKNEINPDEDQLHNDASFGNIVEESFAFEPKKEITETQFPIEITDNDLPVVINQQIIPVESEDEKKEPLILNQTGEDTLAFEPKEADLENDQLINDAPFENKNEEPFAFQPKEELSETSSSPDELINNDLPVEKKKEEIIPFESKQANVDPANSNQPEEETLAFEPLYTVDYFASQGIKIKEEALMNDKLGKQMKSFTEWLKSMKKLHPGKMPEQNEVIEKIIQSSAEESNADAEVLTEAMAEVLVKQNKDGKAIQMYQKLSLLNPSKSAYFAAKIESLKIS